MAVIVLDYIECPYCGQVHREFKAGWVRCDECGDFFRVRKTANGSFEIAGVGDVPYAEAKAATANYK